DSYSILLLKEKLLVSCWSFVEGEFYSSKMARKDAVSFLRKEAFLNKNEAENLIDQSSLDFFPAIKGFIGMVEMESLKKEYEIKTGQKYNLFNFNKEVLLHGAIPFYKLKKEVISM
ncbi:uncharacterized protein METZ01_LOCUS433144, partial [marine metagenome]